MLQTMCALLSVSSKDVFDRVHGSNVLLASPLAACASGVSEDCVSTLKKYEIRAKVPHRSYEATRLLHKASR